MCMVLKNTNRLHLDCDLIGGKIQWSTCCYGTTILLGIRIFYSPSISSMDPPLHVDWCFTNSAWENATCTVKTIVRLSQLQQCHQGMLYTKEVFFANVTKEKLLQAWKFSEELFFFGYTRRRYVKSKKQQPHQKCFLKGNTNLTKA